MSSSAKVTVGRGNVAERTKQFEQDLSNTDKPVPLEAQEPEECETEDDGIDFAELVRVR